MNYCPKCGAELHPNADVCSFCDEEIRTPHQHERAYRPNYYKPASDSGVEMIKVISVILTVFGGISLLLHLNTMEMFDEVIKEAFEEAKSIMVYEFFMIAIVLTVGIIGLSKHRDSKNANLFIIMGALLIGLRAIDLIWTMSVLEVDPVIIAVAILGFVLPILLIVGGSKMKRNLKQE